MLLHPAQSYGTQRLPEKWAMLLIPNETIMSREILSPQGCRNPNFMSLPPLQWLHSLNLSSVRKLWLLFSWRYRNLLSLPLIIQSVVLTHCFPSYFLELFLPSWTLSLALIRLVQTQDMLVILLPYWEPAHVLLSLLSWAGFATSCTPTMVGTSPTAWE